MVIAVDFDGTIVEHAYPEIGRPIPFAIDTLMQLQKDNHKLILWTSVVSCCRMPSIIVRNRASFYAAIPTIPVKNVKMPPVSWVPISLSMTAIWVDYPTGGNL